MENSRIEIRVYDEAEDTMGDVGSGELSLAEASGWVLYILKWLIENEKLSDDFLKRSGPALEAYRKGEKSLLELYDEECTAIFSSDMLNSDGNAFVEAYFPLSSGRFWNDVSVALKVPRPRVILFSESDYLKVKPVIDSRYAAWKSGDVKAVLQASLWMRVLVMLFALIGLIVAIHSIVRWMSGHLF